MCTLVMRVSLSPSLTVVSGWGQEEEAPVTEEVPDWLGGQELE